MEMWIWFLMEVIYLGWKLAIIMSWVICEFKADLMVTCNLNYTQTWVKAGRWKSSSWAYFYSQLDGVPSQQKDMMTAERDMK